jgi:hypothetical protein
MLHHSSIIGQGSSDKDLLRSLSQALLECLDRHDHHDRLNSAIEGATRICPAEILVKCQLEITLMDEDSWRYGNDLQAISVAKSHTPVAFNRTIHLPWTDVPLMSLPKSTVFCCKNLSRSMVHCQKGQIITSVSNVQVELATLATFPSLTICD